MRALEEGGLLVGLLAGLYLPSAWVGFGRRGGEGLFFYNLSWVQYQGATSEPVVKQAVGPRILQACVSNTRLIRYTLQKII